MSASLGDSNASRPSQLTSLPTHLGYLRHSHPLRIEVERQITISAVNRLGRRLRERGVSPADQDLLELLLVDSFQGLTAVSEALRADLPDVSFTPRLKTVGTIVDKLR